MDRNHLDQTLRDLQTLHAVILTDGSVWAPGVPVPPYLTGQLRNNRRAVRSRIAQSSIYVCPSPDLHRRSWSYCNGKYWCADCARLQRYVS
jgi:hypothetical protein